MYASDRRSLVISPKTAPSASVRGTRHAAVVVEGRRARVLLGVRYFLDVANILLAVVGRVGGVVSSLRHRIGSGGGVSW